MGELGEPGCKDSLYYEAPAARGSGPARALSQAVLTWKGMFTEAERTGLDVGA